MNTQSTSARRITLADHFITRFSFTELFHSYNYFSAGVAFSEIAESFWAQDKTAFNDTFDRHPPNEMNRSGCMERRAIGSYD